MNRRRISRRLRAKADPRAWLGRNLQVLLSSLGRLWQRPMGSFMSILVIAIAMALPTALYLVTDNLQRLSRNWEGSASATLFLRTDVTADQVEQVLQRLKTMPEIGRLQHLTPEQALAEFEQYSGLGEAVSLLEENPLPHVVLIQAADAGFSAGKLSALLQRLEKLPEVETASADLQWVARFQAMIRILHRGALLLAALLALAVLLVIGNTIRLEIQGREREIAVVKLVGGSRAFIRRPFLYEGFWYGLLGSLGALLLVILSRWLLQEPVRQLSQLYASGFSLQGPSLTAASLVVASGCLLGVAGAWIAVHQQLDRIEPG